MKSEAIVVLTTPVKFGKDEVQELTLRAPTVKEIREIGLPFTFGADGKQFSINEERIAKYASKLSAMPPSTIDQINAVDFMTLVSEIGGFFGQSAEAPSKN